MVTEKSYAETAVTANILTAKASAQTSDSSNVTHPAPASRNLRYRICRSDILILTFPIAPEFDQENITVMPDGYVNLQGVGSVYVLGVAISIPFAAWALVEGGEEGVWAVIGLGLYVGAFWAMCRGMEARA